MISARTASAGGKQVMLAAHITPFEMGSPLVVNTW